MDRDVIKNNRETFLKSNFFTGLGWGGVGVHSDDSSSSAFWSFFQEYILIIFYCSLG